MKRFQKCHLGHLSLKCTHNSFSLIYESTLKKKVLWQRHPSLDMYIKKKLKRANSRLKTFLGAHSYPIVPT